MAKDYGQDYLERVMRGTHDRDAPVGMGRAAAFNAQTAVRGGMKGNEWKEGPNDQVNPRKRVE